MFTVSIIGVGRVGGALALGLPSEQYLVERLIHRGEAERIDEVSQLSSAAEVVTLGDVREIASDIVFITTQDSEIAAVAKALASKLHGGSCVFHTSGALSSRILNELAQQGCKTGSIHPLVSISNAALGPERFRRSYFCVEGHPDAVDTARMIVTSLGGIPFSVDTNFKTLYHAAAVTACGHLVALFDAAVEMMSKTGLSVGDSKKILLPLVKSTVENLGEQSTAQALTGTFARADIDTFVEHLKILNTMVSDDLLEIYLLLGERSLELAAKQGVNAERIDTMRTKVSIAKSKLKW
jgi:predicted short-subunit dehydrogenase-like oxidoreductase (DUF2520 family)